MKPKIYLAPLAAALSIGLFVPHTYAVTCQAGIAASNPDSAYTDNGNGTVTHIPTGLTWKRCQEGQIWSSGTCTGTATKANWSQALTQAATSNYAGQTDWRLPNVKELRSLVEECRMRPSINDTIFPNTPGYDVWSGSPYASYAGYAWYVNFNHGGSSQYFRNLSFGIRLVRNAQSSIPAPTPITPSVPVIAPISGGLPNQFTFAVTLSRALAAGEYVALNFDDQNGGWYTEKQPGGQVRMTCSGTTCTLVRELDKPGLRSFRAGVFGASGQAVGAYSASATCTLPQCIAATAMPVEVGNPALSGSGSLLLRGVDVATGNYHLSATDLTVPSKGPDFVLMRAYNSRTGQWSFNLDTRAVFALDSNRRISIGPREDGRTQNFFKDMDGRWYPLNPGNFDRLVQESDGSFTLYTQGNLYYRFASPSAAGAGRLASIHDRDGSALVFSHTANLVTGATDASGRSYRITRDGGGRITRVTDFTNRYVEYSWTASGIVAARNPNGHWTTYSYSGQQLTAITDPRKNVQMSIAYVGSGTHAGKVASVTDGAGNAWNYTYANIDGQPATAVVRPSVGTTNNNLAFILDGARTAVLERIDSHNVGNYLDSNNVGNYRSRTTRKAISSLDRFAEVNLATETYRPNNARTAFGYASDGSGNPLTITTGGTGVASMLTEAGWATVDNQPNMTPLQSLRRPGVAKAAEFGSFTAGGKAQSIIDALNQRRTRAYSGGLLTSSTDARNATTALRYDSGDGQKHGLPNRVTNALGHYTETTYDALGRAASVRNARNNVTRYTHDANGNVITITDADGGVVTHTYDESDNLVQTTDARGNTTVYSYDALNRKSRETYTVGGQQRTRTFAYDAMGRLHRITNEKGHTAETRFDARGNTLQEINPLSQTVTYTYDANGNVASVTDAAGRTLSYQYDALDRKTRATDALNNYEAYTYNAQGLLASQRDGRGKTTQYEYDALGRMTRVIDSEGGQTLASYDANGNLTAATDRKGQTVRYQYDALNRMTLLTDAVGRQWTFNYDANGNLLSRGTPGGQTTSYTYDKLDRVSSVSYPGGPSVSYGYDANGNRLTMADSNGVTNYGYDEQNRLTSLKDAFGNNVAWRYDAAGLMDRLTYPGNRSVTYNYNAAGQMTSLTDWLNHTTAYTRDNSGAVIATQYGNGAKVQKTYDAAGRLITLVNRNAANATISSHGLTLDGIGNPVSAALDLPLLPTNLGQSAEMIYDASNRLTSIGGKAITHDVNGRLTGDASGSNAIQYAYNAQDLITTASRAGQVTDSYAYDGDGRRVARTSAGQTTRYVLDPTGGDLYRLLAETNASNAVQQYYVYGDGGLVSQISGSSHRYYHFDQTGNTLALTNSSGTVTDTYAYEPFGNTTVQGSSHNPFRFVGQYGVMDDGNGLHHMRARYYRPDLRRFVSLDALYGQIDDPMTLNRFQYVSGNPMVGVDPSGMKTQEEVTKKIAELSQKIALKKELARSLELPDNFFSSKKNRDLTEWLIVNDSEFSEAYAKEAYSTPFNKENLVGYGMKLVYSVDTTKDYQGKFSYLLPGIDQKNDSELAHLAMGLNTNGGCIGAYLSKNVDSLQNFYNYHFENGKKAHEKDIEIQNLGNDAAISIKCKSSKLSVSQGVRG